MTRRCPLVAAAVLVVLAAALLGWTVVERALDDRDLREARASLRIENARVEQPVRTWSGAAGS